MKAIAIIIGLTILSFTPFQRKDTEWTVIYGELNDNLAFNEVDGNYYYDNIEYFFINNKINKCFRNLDSNQITYAKSLIESKITELNGNNFDKRMFEEATIASIRKENINIQFTDKQGRNVLDKINLEDTVNDNVLVYTKYKDKFLETMWTDRNGKTRKKKKLMIYDCN